MTMTVDNSHRFGSLNFDHMSYSNPPQFTNPWPSASSAPTSAPTPVPAPNPNLYPSSNHLGLAGIAKQQHAQRLSGLGSYAHNVPGTTASADLLSPNRAMSMSFGNDASYASASPVPASYAPSASPYEALGYAPAPVRSTYALPQHQDTRRLSQSSVLSSASSVMQDARSFGDAIDASRGMIAMSQNTTPRNIYGPRSGRGSGDSYGFPSTHSTSSSISSNSTYPSYYGGSIDSSVSDYSTTGSDMESVSSRTLPRPSALLTNGLPPPAPQSMMSQFSSKISSSTQKKHRCKVCDKRFTRPSSLQTHMYSHTGEKPFSCEVEGCGRHFSVVSNLRRHRKVHKGEARSEAGSDDHHSDD